MLLYLRDEDCDLDRFNIAIEIPAKKPQKAQSAFDFGQYLEQLGAAELRTLVKQFAPESFRLSLAAQHAGTSDAARELNVAQRQINNLFKKAEASGPSDFDQALTRGANSLRQFWLTHPSGVLDILKNCLQQLDEAQGEGYLYDDYTDSVFKGNAFGQYLAEFVAAQAQGSIVPALTGLWEQMCDCEYAFCEAIWVQLPRLLSDTQVREVWPFFVNSGAMATLGEVTRRLIWTRFQPLLNSAEQQEWLNNLQFDDFFVLRLATLQEQIGDPEAAVETLEKGLAPERQQVWAYGQGWAVPHQPLKKQLFEHRIRLEQEHHNGRNTRHWVQRYLQEQLGADTLHFAVKTLPAEQRALETTLRNHSTEAFARYLEDQKRLEEVLALFALPANAPGEPWQYDFFKRHKKKFPAQAQVVFENRLNEYLATATSKAYAVVAEALVQLKAVETPAAFALRVEQILQTYKRRTSLLELLRQANL